MESHSNTNRQNIANFLSAIKK